jgi:hypothetical protein
MEAHRDRGLTRRRIGSYAKQKEQEPQAVPRPKLDSRGSKLVAPERTLAACDKLIARVVGVIGVVNMHEIADTFALSSGRLCTLYRIRRDMIPDYYLLSFPRDAGEPSPTDLSEMLVLGMTRAQSLARKRVGDPGAYSVLYSGYSARREQGWHVHIVLLTGRWKKAWLYLVLAGKNALQAVGLRRDDAPRFSR